MKISFSTLGCPDFSWQEIYSIAKDFGFHGIEMRGLGGDIFSVKASPFKPENLAKTREQLKKLKLEICCLSSGCPVRYPETREETIEENKAFYLELLHFAEALFMSVKANRNLVQILIQNY